MFLNCSYFLVIPLGTIKTTLRNTCLLLFHPVVCEKTVSANVTSLLITPPALDDPANPNRFSNTHTSHFVYKDLINFLNFSDQNFSLVVVLSLFFIYGQISAPGILIKFVLIKKKKRVIY